ncbi:CRISPR-associated endonuclease Cas1 [anaerobic digester metagenome]|jgi:CRISP-associated protein Cas1
MRKLLNTLYITNPESYLKKDGENIVVSVERNEIGRIPIHNLEGVICFGFMGASPGVMELCASRNVGLAFVSPYGKFLGRVSGRVSGNVLLRKRQYLLSDDEEAATGIAMNCVLGKLLNCRSVLLRFGRDYPEKASPALAENLKRLTEGIRQMKESPPGTLNELRGREGILSKCYFDCFDDLILSRDPAFTFEFRSRRPPLNRINALLSFIYTLTAVDCASALESVGLDPQVGFLHRARPGRMSLALDLMEEFRPYLGDRFVLSLINNRIVAADDFLVKENGAVILTDAGRKAVLAAWQRRKTEEVMHGYLDERVPVGLLPYAQSMLLARHLRGDIDGYPPFVMR